MKKFFTLCLAFMLALLVNANAVGHPSSVAESNSITKTITFSELGYENQTALTTIESEGLTIEFDSGGNNSNSPKYYTSGTAIRLYPKNNFTITAPEGKLITNVTFGHASGYPIPEGEEKPSPKIIPDCGSFADPTWIGSASSVKFTLDPEATKGQHRFASFEITYAANDGSLANANIILSGEMKNTNTLYYHNTLTTPSVKVTLPEGATHMDIEVLKNGAAWDSYTNKTEDYTFNIYDYGNFVVNVTAYAEGKSSTAS